MDFGKHQNTDIISISKITDNIFISGIIPMEMNPELIRKNNIKYILCCVKKNNVQKIHEKIMMENPNIIVLYLPYDDMLYQNLWHTNNNIIDILKYTGSIYDNSEINKIMNLYNNRPLIEIGYHFIDKALTSKQNILIHCMAGISRSVSLATYYFMKKINVNFEQAYKFIRSKRKIADPNISFQKQLETYEIYREKFTENCANKIIKNARYFSK